MKQITIYGASVVLATITDSGEVRDLTSIGGQVDIGKTVIPKRAKKNRRKPGHARGRRTR